MVVSGELPHVSTAPLYSAGTAPTGAVPGEAFPAPWRRGARQGVPPGGTTVGLPFPEAALPVLDAHEKHPVFGQITKYHMGVSIVMGPQNGN